MTDIPRAPRHLEGPGKALWKAVNGDYALESHQLVVLQTACEALDRMTQAREAIRADGLTYADGKGGIHPHPCVSIERDSRIAVLRALRELNLDTTAAEEYTRPTRIPNRYS